jgi:hypothetical protein
MPTELLTGDLSTAEGDVNDPILWVAGTGLTVTRNTNLANVDSGSKSWQVTNSGTGQMDFMLPFANAIPCTPGDFLDFTVRIKTIGNYYPNMRIGFYSAVGGLISNLGYSSPTNAPNVWVTGTARSIIVPAEAAFFSPQLQLYNQVNGATTFFDDIRVTINDMVVRDLFSRTSTTTLGTADTGQAWTPNNGTWGTNGTDAYLVTSGAGDQNTAVIDSGLADCTPGVRQSAIGSSGICFRSTDNANNFITNESNGLFRREGGTFFSMGTLSTGAAANDVIEAVLEGSSISIRVNGVQQLAVTSTHNQTATKHGLRDFGVSAARFADFRVLGVLTWDFNFGDTFKDAWGNETAVTGFMSKRLWLGSTSERTWLGVRTKSPLGTGTPRL